MTISKGTAIILASAARTASPANVEINKSTVGISLGAVTNIDIIVDVTATADTPSLTVAIQAKDPASGELYDLLAGIAAITTTSTVIYQIGKDVVDAAGLAANTSIPDEVVLKFTHADTDSITYSVGMNCEFDK